MRQMWVKALALILEDFGDDADAARRYLQSRDGRLVCDMAGFAFPKLDRLNLKANHIPPPLTAEEVKERRLALAEGRARNRALERNRKEDARAAWEAKKESARRASDRQQRFREIDRRIAKEKADPRQTEKLVLLTPGTRPPVGSPSCSAPKPRPINPSSICARIHAECDRLVAMGEVPSVALILEALPEANPSTVRTQWGKWKTAWKPGGKLPAPAPKVLLPAPVPTPAPKAEPSHEAKAAAEVFAAEMTARANDKKAQLDPAIRAAEDARAARARSEIAAVEAARVAKEAADKVAAKEAAALAAKEAARAARAASRADRVDRVEREAARPIISPEERRKRALASKAAYRERQRVLNPPAPLGRPGKTKPVVFAACDHLAAAGIEPTGPLLRQRLPEVEVTTLGPYLTEWRNARGRSVRPQDPSDYSAMLITPPWLRPQEGEAA